jgi:hypothetical protein
MIIGVKWVCGKTSGYGHCWDSEERVEGSDGDERATVSAALQCRAGTVYARGRGPVARAVREAGNAGRGLRPRSAREKVFPSNLLLD